uniref:Uncharacterized protein n=1 Tax=viral metagenome TaxID=1070528 RepID=A0A6M3IZ12_9ZZZZ
MKLRSLTKLKPDKRKNRKTDKYLPLPAIKKIHIELDYKFISDCLQKKSHDFDGLKWPEALKALHKKAERAEIELSHIESCCRKARVEQITPYKNKLWNLLLPYTRSY